MTDNEYKQSQRIQQLETIGSPIYEWLNEIGADFKKKGIFPPSLCDFYTNREDKEVAAVVDLIIPHSPKRISYIIELRKILGDAPWKMVKEREFLTLGLPQNERRILKNIQVTSSSVFNVLDWIWKCSVDLEVPIEHIFKGECGIVRPSHQYPLCDVIRIKELPFRTNLLMAKMNLKDGYGEAIWNTSPKKISYPYSKGTKKILSAFFRVRGEPDKDAFKRAICLCGLENHLEFLYIEWAYLELTQARPHEALRLERLFKKRLKNQTSYSRKDAFSDILPKK